MDEKPLHIKVTTYKVQCYDNAGVPKDDGRWNTVKAQSEIKAAEQCCGVAPLTDEERAQIFLRAKVKPTNSSKCKCFYAP